MAISPYTPRPKPKKSYSPYTIFGPTGPYTVGAPPGGRALFPKEPEPTPSPKKMEPPAAIPGKPKLPVPGYRPTLAGVELSKEDYETAKGMVGFPSGKGGVMTPDVLRAVEAWEKTPEEARAAAFEEATRAGVLGEELMGKIEAPPGMEPEPITAKTVEIQRKKREFIGKLVTGKATSEEIIDEAKKFITGIGIAGAVAAAVFAAPHVAALAAKTAAVKLVTSSPMLKTAVAGLGLYVVGGRVFDYEGAEMDVYRQGMKKVVEDGERIEAAVRNGYPPEDAINILRTMAEEIDAGESRIKELGMYNLEYRISKEYILDQQNARSAREAILRRVLAIQNIAATGVASEDPEALMFSIAQWGEA